MGKKASSRGKKRSIFWIGLLILIIMMGALGWQAKSLLEPRPAPAPVAVRAKVPQAPQTTTIQIPEPATQESQPAQGEMDAVAQAPDTNAQESLPSQPDLQATGPGTPPEHPAATQGPASAIEPPPEPMPPSGQTAENQPPAAEDLSQAQQPEQTAATPSETVSPAPEKEAVQSNLPGPSSEPNPAAAKSKPSPAPEVKEDRPAPPPEQTAPYTIQVGAFRVKSYADDKIAQLTRKGYNPYIFETAGVNQKPWYAVRFGHFKTRDKAVQALLDFKEKEKMDGIISRSGAL